MKASTRKRIWGILAIVSSVALFLVVVPFTPIGEIIRHANEWSAISSLQHEIETELQAYHAQHGRYPDSLRALTIDYSKTDQATPAHLGQFIYRATDTDYELTTKQDAQTK